MKTAILSLEKNIQEYLTQRRGDAEGNSEFANYSLNSASRTGGSMRLGVRKFEVRSFEKSSNLELLV
jgi:hypothetical protein